MSRAVLALEIPDDVWMGAITRRYPTATFRVTAAAPNEAGGVAVAELLADDPGPILDAIEAREAVTALELLEADEERVLLEIETRAAVFLDAAREAGIPIRTPFSVADGEITWELTASRQRLSALDETLSAAGVSFTVESIYEEIDSDQLLTDRQWTIVQEAVERGYYDTPRDCTQEELASEVDLAKSTCSDLLHRAEEQIIKRLADPDADAPPRADHVPGPV